MSSLKVDSALQILQASIEFLCLLSSEPYFVPKVIFGCLSALQQEHWSSILKVLHSMYHSVDIEANIY